MPTLRRRKVSLGSLGGFLVTDSMSSGALFAFSLRQRSLNPHVSMIVRQDRLSIFLL